MDSNEINNLLKQWRGLEEDVCSDCGGAGIKSYSSTATWHGGIGGQMITSAVCDKCWGSGNDKKPGVNQKVLMHILTKDQKDQYFKEVFGR
jgi:hypothetical protein